MMKENFSEMTIAWDEETEREFRLLMEAENNLRKETGEPPVSEAEMFSMIINVCYVENCLMKEVRRLKAQKNRSLS